MSGRDQQKPSPELDDVPIEYWEHLKSTTREGRPLNGHRGYYAYHNDDCQCSVWGDHHCNRYTVLGTIDEDDPRPPSEVGPTIDDTDYLLEVANHFRSLSSQPGR